MKNLLCSCSSFDDHPRAVSWTEVKHSLYTYAAECWFAFLVWWHKWTLSQVLKLWYLFWMYQVLFFYVFVYVTMGSFFTLALIFCTMLLACLCNNIFFKFLFNLFHILVFGVFPTTLFYFWISNSAIDWCKGLEVTVFQLLAEGSCGTTAWVMCQKASGAILLMLCLSLEFFASPNIS